MKLERFIKEYANYQIRSINSYDMKDDIKKKLLDEISKVLKLRKRGLITTNEAMQELSRI